MTRNGHVVFSRMEEVVFGRPAAEAVAEQAARLGAARILVMASATLARETDQVTRIRDALGQRFATLFQGMPAHSPRSAVLEATRAAREAGADLIVTVGGGSLTDAAKAVQLCLANGIDSVEAMDGLRPGSEPLQSPKLRQVSVPTTLSAGEFSALSGVTDERRRVKEVFHHPGVIPVAVVLDPAMTLATPEWLFLSTGIRAVDHCVEGVCSAEAQPYADAQALHGLGLLASGLPRVKANPADLDARLDCQIGSWLSMAPLATGVPMGASHGIGYVLGAAFDIPHGHTSCIMLPAVMGWNRAANTERQAMVAAAMGRPGVEAAEALHALIAGLDMPRSLGAVGIGRDPFPNIAERAMSTPWVPRNPRRIEGPAQIMEILKLAA